MPPIDFPTSTQPGINSTENGGRLINCYAEAAPEGSRGSVVYRRAPGLIERFTLGNGVHRGALLVGSILYVINDDNAFAVTSNYVVTQLTGTIGGSGPVFMSRNMATIPDILIVHSDGMSKIAAGAVSDFVDIDLPAVNSIDWIDGYFMVTTEAGTCHASGINATSFTGTDYTTAESSPDGLLRNVAFGRELLLMGSDTVEFWTNTGNPTGFPFSRGTVIMVGLAGKHAVAGYERGFPGPLAWVTNTNTVVRLDGYTPTKISPPVLDRLIENVADKSTIEASVFISSGHPCVAISSPTWTWVYDLSTGNWHERKTIGASRWRARFGVNAFGKWMTFDRDTPSVFSVEATARWEGAKQLVFEMRSKQQHRFPGRFWVKRASFDFLTGTGDDTIISPIETDPVVSISWSRDGGRTFGNDLLRRLGTQGEFPGIDIWRAGLFNRLGWQVRMRISDPVDLAFFGAAADIEERAA